ncbi:MAG: SDR family NAD(P)-dependent oxidoreductase [bacterium]
MTDRRFEGKVAVVTGGARGIGRAIAQAFEREGAVVHIIDIASGNWFVGDVSDPRTLERFAEAVIAERGHVDYLINNALPLVNIPTAKAGGFRRSELKDTQSPWLVYTASIL